MQSRKAMSLLSNAGVYRVVVVENGGMAKLWSEAALFLEQ